MEQLKIAQQDSINRTQAASPISFGGNVGKQAVQDAATQKVAPLIPETTGDVSISATRQWESDGRAVEADVNAGLTLENIEEKYGSGIFSNTFAIPHLVRAKSRRSREAVAFPIIRDTKAFAAIANEVNAESAGGDWTRVEDKKKKAMISLFLNSKGFTVRDYAQIDEELKTGVFKGESLDEITDWVFNSYLAEQARYDNLAQYMRTLDTDKQRFLEENGYKDSTDFFVKNAPEEMGNNLLALQKMSPADRRVAVEIAAKMREADSLGEWVTTTYQSRIAEKIGTLSPERQARIMAMVQSMNPKLSRSFGIELAGKVAESFSDTFNGLETFLEAGFVHAGAWLNDVDIEEHEWYKREQEARSAALNTVRTRYAERGAVGSILMDTGVAFADTASIMALGWATGGAGAAAGTFAWFGGGSAGNAYTDLISRGVDTKTALLSSLEVGAVEAGSEYLQAVIPLGKGVSNFVAGKGAKSMALNMLSKDYFYKVASGAATATTKKALMRGAGRAALGMAEETGTELVAVGNKALVYDALGVSVDGEFLGEVSDTVKTMPGVFLLGALTGAGAAKIRNRKNGGRMPSVTQLGAELDLAKMETAKQKAQAMRLAGQMLDLSFDAGTGTVRAHGRDGRVSEIDMDAWADMNDAERRQELEAKFFRGEKHDENDTEKAMAFFDFVQKTAEFTADNAKAATDVNAPLDKDANAEAKQAAGAIPGTVETSTGTPTPEASREALQDFVERMPIWKELGEAAPDMDISSDLSAAFGYNVEPEHPDVAEALKTLFERGDADATLAQILNEYAKSAIAQAKLGGNAKANPLALLVEKANAFGDAGGHTGERIAAPQQGEESAGTTIPQTALDDIPNTGKYFKTLSQASGVNVRHIEALSGNEYSLSRARREVKSVLSGKKKLAQISDTGKALLRATMRFDGNARALADWISAYAAGARKGGKNTKELEDAAFEFAAGSREQRPVSEYESLRVETEAKSEAEQNLLRTVSRLNAATGGNVSVKFFDGSFFDANGFIDKDNVIHINRNAPEPLLKTFGHEFTHYLETNKGFAGLKKFILNPDGACVRVFLDRYGFSAFEDAKEKYKKLYGTQGGQNLSDEAIEREILADVCGAVLFTRSFDALFEIRQENKNFFNRCLEFLRKLFRATRGTKIENEIANAVDRYRAVAFEQRAVLGSFSHFEQDSAKSVYNPLKPVKTVEISTNENAYSEQSATFKAIGEGQWEIPAEITAAIPALKGKVVCDKEAYEHIGKHLGELKQFGYESAENFVADTLAYANAVYVSKSGDGFDIVADLNGENRPVNRVLIYLKKSESGDFYDVGTAHIVRRDQYKNKKPLWERAQSNQSSEENPLAQSRAKADVSNATQATPERNEKLLDEISARNDVGGVFMAYAKEAGLSFKFPGQYPSFRTVLELVAKKRGVPVGEVSAEALGAVAFAQKHVGISKTETTTTAEIKPNEFEALTPSAENAVRIKGHYRVVDLSDLTFVDVSDKTQQDEQERNRSGKRTEEQVQRMLMNFESERLGDDRHTDRGAPIYREVDGGLRSVSGEGRSRLLKKVYELGGVPEAQYREHVAKFARERGIEIPESVKQPVLLRVATDTGGLTWAQLAKASNTDMKSVYSTAEEAHADARELPKILNLLSGRSDEGILDERNNAFIMAFNEAIGAGTQYTQDRKSGFKETIGLRIENALVAYVINDREAATDLFDSPYSLGKTLASLRDHAVDLVRLKDNEQYDIAPELAAALKAALHAREQKERGNKQTSEQILELYFEQNTFDFEKNAREGIDLGAAKMLANLMLEKRTSRLGYVLFGYIDEVERANGIDGNDIGLFGTQDWGTKSELMQKALDKLDGNAGDVRYSLGFSRGDAEAQRLMEEATPKVIARTNTEAIEALKKIQGKPIVNRETGIEAVIRSNQRGKLISNKAADKSVANGFTREQHNTAAANIKDLFERAHLFFDGPDKNAEKEVKSIKRFASLIVFDGVPAEADILVKETEQGGNRIYTVELQEIKMPSERGSESIKVNHDVATPTSDGKIKVAEEAAKVNGIRYSLIGERGNAEAQKIEAEAKANGTWLKAPNGKPSKLNPRQWVQVRTEAFKKWFGDWEFEHQLTQILQMSPIHSLAGTEFQKDGVPLTDKVTAFWKEKHNGVAVNPTLGEVKLDREGVKDSLGHGIGSLKSAAYAAVPSVIERGIIFDRQTNWKNRGYDTAVLAAPITINGKEYICEVVVETRPNRQGFYLHEVELKEKVENAFKTPTKGSASPTSRLILNQKADKVKQDGVSQIIDENGEPLVVYHQTGNEFWAFDTSIQTHSRGDSGTPIGIFVKPDDKDIGFAGKKQMALFAKVANVKRFKNREDVSTFARRNANYIEAVKQIAENDKKFSREIEEVGKQIDEVYSKWWKAGRKTNIRENAEFNALQKKSSSIFDKWKSENDKFGSEARSLLTQDLKAQGYDGIFIEQDAGSFGRNTETYVVFENAGVKSATDNAGTFDASNPDIRWSLSQPSLPGMESAGFDLFDKVVPAEEKPVLEELKNQKKKRVAFDAFRRKDGERKSLQDVQNTFGLISLKIGKRDGKPWTTTEEIYDALLDLAEIADIPPAAIGLGGRLALEFTGRKATTKGGGYKPFKKYITAYQRGVVAHEWVHALDHYFGGLFGDRARKNNYNGTDIRPEVLEAFDNLNKTIKDSKFKVRSREFAFSREGNSYWTQPRELLARAFEVYAFVKSAYSDEALKLAEEAETIAKEYKFKSKTEELDIRSEEAKAIRARWKEIYDKAQQTTPLLASGKNFRELQVYPKPEELERDGITAAFDKLFETLEWEQQGRNVRLYSLSMRNSLDALEAIANGAPYGVLHNAKYGEIHYPLGRMGKGGFGFLHIVEQRIKKDGATIDEAIEIALRVGIAAEIGEETRSEKNTRHLDIYGYRAIIALMDDGVPIITGYKISADEIEGAKQPSSILQRNLPVRKEDVVAALKKKLAQMRDEVNPETRFSLSMMNENESFEEWASRIPKLEPRKKRSADKARLHDINARSRRMIQDFIREHNELYSDPKQVRRLKVLGVALAKVLLERKLQSASEPILDAICKDAPAILRNDIKARGEMLARLMRENLDNAQAVQATIEDIAAMSNRVGRMRAYARLASMMNFGSAEAYDAIDALTRERKAKLAFAQARDVDKAKLEQIGVTKRLNAIGLSADLSQDAEDKRRRMDEMLTEAENDESDGDDAGTASGATEDADEGGEKAPAPGTQKDALKQLQDTPKAVAHELVQLVLDTIFGEGKVQAARMATDLKKIGATDEQIAGLVKTLRKTGTKALMDAMHEAVPVESRSRIGVVIGKIATEDNPARIRKLLENGFNLVALSSTRATRAQAYQKINRLLKPFARMKSRESNLNRRVDGERELYFHACYKAWTQYHSMKQAADRMEEIQKSLNALGANMEPTENDFALRKVLERELHALSLVGGARVKSVIDLLQVAWELEHGIETDKEAHEKRVEEVRERNAEAYGEIANAVRARKAVPDRKQGALEQLFTGVESFRQRLEGLIRFAGGATEAVARERIEQMDKDLANAAYRKESMAYMRVHALRDALEKIFGKDIASELKRWHKHDEALSVFSYDMKTPLTLAQVANIYAQVRQEHYAAPLKTKSIKERKSFRFKQEDIELIERRISQIPAMEAALGEKGVAVVDALCGLLRDIQPELRAAFKGVTGYEFFTEENYFPIQRHDKSKGARRRGPGLKGINLSALPLRFSTRVVSAVDIAEDSSIFDVFDDASGASEHFIAYSQAHLFWQQAFSDPEFSDVIRKHHGKAVLNDFREHVTTILAPEQLDSGDFKAVNKLTSFAAISALGGNTLVMLRQMTGAPAFMFNMKSMDFAGYVTTALSPDGLKAVREICRENSWFKTRFGRALNDDLFAMTRGDGAFTATKARALAWYMITNNLGDAVPILFVGQGIFRATYEACLNKGMNEAQAKEVAHAEVARHAEASQQSNRVMNMSVFNRKNSSIARAVQQFKSTTQQFLSYEVRAISDVMARPTDAARWRRLGKVVLLNHIILPGAYSATTMLFDLLIGGDTDEWSEEWFSKFVMPMLLGPASGIFFVGDALTTIGGGLSRGLPAAEIISKGRRLWRAGTAMIDEDTDKALDETFKFFMDNCPPLRHAYELYENRVED